MAVTMLATTNAGATAVTSDYDELMAEAVALSRLARAEPDESVRECISRLSDRLDDQIAEFWS